MEENDLYTGILKLLSLYVFCCLLCNYVYIYLNWFYLGLGIGLGNLKSMVHENIKRLLCNSK